MYISIYISNIPMHDIISCLPSDGAVNRALWRDAQVRDSNPAHSCVCGMYLSEHSPLGYMS